MNKTDAESILEVRDLTKVFNTNQGPLTAVNKVNFSIKRGEIFGLVGESGSGKSTIGSMIAGLYGTTSGSITFKGQDISGDYKKRSSDLKKDIQLVFQDPGSSLNPRKPIQKIMNLPLNLYHGKNMDKDAMKRRIEHAFERVGLPLDYLEKYPRSIGTGEKQLVSLARALEAEPSFIVLDEPTSALDVSIQAKITNKLIDLQQKSGLSYLFITHNLCLVRNMVHRTAIMYLGEICEMADTKRFFENPLHPYTKMLLASIPVLSDEEEKLKPESVQSVGEIPSPLNRPSGCSFSPRCPFKKDICTQLSPEMTEPFPEHFVCCHIYGKNYK